MKYNHKKENGINLFSRKAWAVVAVIGIIGLIFLLRDHTSHVFLVLPFLILLACPLMHVFMHGSHGGHGDDSSPDRQKSNHQH